jgi:triacylglycerol lipase
MVLFAHKDFASGVRAAALLRVRRLVDSMASAPRDPVVLVHGYMDASGTPWWSGMERRLRAAGYDEERVYRVDLGAVPGTTVGSPRRYGRRVHDAVAEAARNHGREVDVLAHSMGGLCARWGIEHLDGADLVDDLVTLGTPHQGSYLAYAGLATAGGRAMVPGSPFLRELNDGALAEGVDYTAVWSEQDGAISPSANAALPVSVFGSMLSARNVRLETPSHMDLVTDPAVFDRYVDFLD